MTKRATVLVLVIAAGCAAKRPVVYPNARFERAAPGDVDRDIEECTRLAETHVSSRGHAGETARRGATGAATGAVIGAAGGAAGGAVVGSAARGAAAGGAGGAAAGLLHGILGAVLGRSRPDETHRRFVDHCLRERGYEPIGWE